jgi:hypothetical protein
MVANRNPRTSSWGYTHNAPPALNVPTQANSGLEWSTRRVFAATYPKLAPNGAVRNLGHHAGLNRVLVVEYEKG